MRHSWLDIIVSSKNRPGQFRRPSSQSRLPFFEDQFGSEQELCVPAIRQFAPDRRLPVFCAVQLAGLLVRRPILRPNGSLTCPNHWLPGTSDRSCSMVPPAALARSRVPSRSATCTYSVTPRPDGCPASDAWMAPIWVSPTFTSTYPSKPCIDSNCHGKIAP